MPRLDQLVAGGLVACMLACGSVDRDGVLRAEATRLQALMVPPGSTLLSASEVTRDAWSVTMTWDIETELIWDEYARWVGERLYGFKVQGIARGIARFSRNEREDLYTLDIESRSIGPPLRVRVTYQVLPS